MQWDVEDRQSERLARYDEVLAQLLEKGRAYACYETSEELNLKRKAQLMAGKPPVYDRAALRLTDAEKAKFESEGRRPHYRFKLDQDAEVRWHDLVRGEVAFPMSSLSDPVILREDGRVIYTMASVVDDADHGITTILRGEDHVTNSAAQIQLFEAIGATPPKMGHLALSVQQLRSEGIEAGAIASLLARIGTPDPVEPHAQLSDVVDGFDLSRFGRATAKFDPAELAMVNARILQHYDADEVADRLAAIGISGDITSFWPAVRGNLNTLAEAADWWAVCTGAITPVIEDDDVCQAAISHLPEVISADIWKDWTSAIAAETGKKGKGLFMPLRLALTGQTRGPEVAGLLPVMGRERIVKRLAGEVA